MNVSIKSGSNEAHGTGYYFNRDSALAARGWTNNLQNLPKNNLKWQQYGGTVGGPIQKNRLFYFGAYEGFLQNFADMGLTTVPTLGQRRGEFGALNIVDPSTNAPFAGNIIPPSRFDALAKKVIDLYSEPKPAWRLPERPPSQ